MSSDQQTHKKKRPRQAGDPVATERPCSAAVNVSDRYEKVGGRVGQGSYGVVYKAKDRVTGHFVALKRCIPHHQASDGFPITTLREIQSLRQCSAHPHIVHLETVAVSKSGGVFLVLEYCDHDLADVLDAHYQKYRKSPFSEANVKTLLQQLLSAVEFLHARHLIHRDVKVSNLLYTTHGHLKLADFGLSRSFAPVDEQFSQRLTPTVASLWYRAPELLLGAKTYSQSIDLWATGCVLGELLQGCPVFNGKAEVDQIQQLFESLGVPTDWPGLNELPLIRDGYVELDAPSKTATRRRTRFLDTFGDLLSSGTGFGLLTSLFQYDPQQRWTATQTLASKFFTEAPVPTPPGDMPQFATTT